MAGPFHFRSSAGRVAGFLALAMVGLGGCETRIEVRGFVPDDDSLATIQIGLQSKDDVRDMLGTPSTVTPFGEDTWLYVSRRTSTVAFMQPTVLSQQVVAVVFDERGVVSDVRKLELADGKVVNHVARATPAPGKELNFLEQLVGNVGRFNKANSAAYIPGGTQSPPPGTRR